MNILLSIDNIPVSVPEGSTILEAGDLAGIKIPTICFHIATTANALCRICVVEVEGQRLLQPACVVKVVDGMKVNTRTERIIRARRTILEMMASSNDLSDAPDVLNLIQEYGAKIDRFPDARKREYEVIDDNPMYIRDYSKCILCWRCVQVCADDAQYVNALSISGRGFDTNISTFFNEPLPTTSCVFCGQCIGVCPTGALKTKSEFLLENGLSPDQITELSMNSKRTKKFERNPKRRS